MKVCVTCRSQAKACGYHFYTFSCYLSLRTNEVNAAISSRRLSLRVNVMSVAISSRRLSLRANEVNAAISFRLLSLRANVMSVAISFRLLSLRTNKVNAAISFCMLTYTPKRDCFAHARNDWEESVIASTFSTLNIPPNYRPAKGGAPTLNLLARLKPCPTLPFLFATRTLLPPQHFTFNIKHVTFQQSKDCHSPSY